MKYCQYIRYIAMLSTQFPLLFKYFVCQVFFFSSWVTEKGESVHLCTCPEHVNSRIRNNIVYYLIFISLYSLLIKIIGFESNRKLMELRQ